MPCNKAIYDLDDPNRPRFTTEELKEILHERNELKAKVSDLEDELENYRPRNKNSESLVLYFDCLHTLFYLFFFNLFYSSNLPVKKDPISPVVETWFVSVFVFNYLL